MSLKDAVWGYCRGCHREVEVRDGLLIEHKNHTGVRCGESSRKPTAPPEEGTWSEPGPQPPQPAEYAVPESMPSGAYLPRWLLGAFRGGSSE